MKILMHEENDRKLCHAKPGDVVQIKGRRAFYLVCTFGPKSKQPYGSSGLFEEGAGLFLVNLANGAGEKMPHLSSTVTHRPDVALTTLRMPGGESDADK